MRIVCSLSLALVAGCLPVDSTPVAESDSGELGGGLAFVDDCDEGLNDALELAVSLEVANGSRVDGIQLCKKEIDYYRFELPPQAYVSLSVIIDGSGSNSEDKTDLDLLEVAPPDAGLSGLLDMVADEDDQVVDTLWYSASENTTERLAWFNPSDEAMVKWVAVDGYKKSAASYSLEFVVDEFHEGLDCDEFYTKTGQKGPCNEILTFPQASSLEDGYVVSHEARYSNLRRELIYLVRWAAAETAATFENTNPIGLLDMSQADGDVPGRQDNQLRHPEGTHIEGNDIDIAYYQTGSNNLGRSVCPENGYYCTDKPDILDARRTAFFISRLMKTKNLRVVGVDTLIYPELISAGEELRAEGLMSYGDLQKLRSYLAYGDGWPFHQHHLHFSWDWESGWSDEDSHSACTLPDFDQLPTKLRTGPGLD